MKSLACVLLTTIACNSDLEGRVEKLEAENAKYKEALDYLQAVYNAEKAKSQQGAQQPQEQRAKQQRPPEPVADPNAQFAVDIAPDIKGGQVDGPNSACVTVVEAWDFA